jgi:hypothetical protein
MISVLTFKFTSYFRYKTPLSIAKSTTCIGELMFKVVKKHCKTLIVANFVH